METHKGKKRAAQQENSKLLDMDNEYRAQNPGDGPLTELCVDGFQTTQHIPILN